MGRNTVSELLTNSLIPSCILRACRPRRFLSCVSPAAQCRTMSPVPQPIPTIHQHHLSAPPHMPLNFGRRTPAHSQQRFPLSLGQRSISQHIGPALSHTTNAPQSRARNRFPGASPQSTPPLSFTVHVLAFSRPGANMAHGGKKQIWATASPYG